MKKVFFALVTVFSVLMISGLASAGSEYDDGLKDYYRGDYKDAVIRLKAHVEQKPDPVAYYIIGYSLYKLGRFAESEEYFNDAYLIDPDFSPEKYGLGQDIQKVKVKRGRKKAAGHTHKHAQATQPGQKAPENQAAPSSAPKAQQKKAQPAKTAVAPLKQNAGTTNPAGPQQKTPPAKSAPSASPQTAGQTSPTKGPQPQKTQPPQPSSPKEAPKAAEPQKTGPVQNLPPMFAGKMRNSGSAQLFPAMMLFASFFAGFFLIAIGIAIALYIYASLCIFLIAKKRNAPYPWTAFVPLVQVWPLVESAGKPAWWIVFIFVPIVNFFVSIYLWVCITENLGKNKWLGLLMILPVINLIFMGILAFSKTDEQPMPKIEEKVKEEEEVKEEERFTD